MLGFEMKEQIYWHFRGNKMSYLMIVGSLSALILFFVVNSVIHERKKVIFEKVKNWTLVEGHILESEVIFRDASGEHGVRGFYHADLRVRYQEPQTGRSVETKVIGHWEFRNDIGGFKQFEVGEVISLRVNPERPEQASLLDVTGSI